MVSAGRRSATDGSTTGVPVRAIWKGAISFGLVSIPVKLYSATEERDVAFHQVRREDGSRVRYKRVAVADGEEVPYAEIAKGYELPSGETVVLTDDDLANLPLSTSRTIDVLEFVPLDQVDPIYFAKSYYLEPDKTGAKPYVLLRDSLEDSGRVALVKLALRQREQLGTLRVRDGVFVLETMLWPDEVRRPDFAFLDEDVTVRPGELAMAASLIETLAGDFDPSQYRDDYREALLAVIDAKIAGQEVKAPLEAEAAPSAAGDLMAALRASVEAARRGRDGGGEAPGGGTASEDRVASDGEAAANGKAGPDGKAGPGSKAAANGKSTSGRTSAGKSASARTSSAKPSPAKPSPAKTSPAKTNKTPPASKSPGKSSAGTRSSAAKAGTTGKSGS
jgi:DNA end-binding protein Ku